MPKKLRPILSLTLLLVVLAIGAIYVADHRTLLHQLARTAPLVTLTVFALYVITFGILMLILSASVRLCRIRLAWLENGLLNAHSLFINFFVPGQGGPAYRGLYLYRRHKLRVKHYIIVTLLYYAIYAVISVCLLLAGTQPWWQIAAGVVVAAVISFAVIKQYGKRARLGKHVLELSVTNIIYLGLATLSQVVVQMAIYAIELHSANPSIQFSQIVTYTGAANLALFVSLTPGAIGIRESFLIFTERLNHISSANIVVANVIDRAVYLIFLLILLVLAVSLHVWGKGKRLHFGVDPELQPAGAIEKKS